MARWHLSFDEDRHTQAISVCKKADLNPYSGLNLSDHFVQAYEKRASKIQNFESSTVEGWICSAGSIVYKGTLGRPALQSVYRDFLESGIEEVRSNAIGHYALAIRHGDTITAFTDPQGAFSLYYVDASTPVILSNSLHVVATNLSERSIDPVRLMSASLHGSIPGRKTFYKGINRLNGTEKIRISLPEHEQYIERIDNPYTGIILDTESINNSVDLYADEIRQFIQRLSCFGSIGVATTGGLDSRTVLASLLDQDHTPLLLYGVGNSRLTHTKREDLKIVESLAQQINAPLYRMDWSGNHPHSDDQLRETFRRLGFSYEIYGAPESFISEFSGGITPFPDVILGGYSPAFTNMKVWEFPERQYPFRDLIDHFSSDLVGHPSFTCETSYRECIQESVQTALNSGGINYSTSGESLRQFVKARLTLKIRTEARFANLANQFCPYIAPFLTKQLCGPLLSVPPSFRKGDEFQIRLMDELCPELLNVPVFSGVKPARINTTRFQMERPQKVRLLQTLVTLGGKVIPSSTKPVALRVLRRLTADPDDDPDINDLIISNVGDSLTNEPLVSHCLDSTPTIALKDLSRLRRNVFGVNQIGYTSIESEYLS